MHEVRRREPKPAWRRRPRSCLRLRS